jgi:hypothetical protein
MAFEVQKMLRFSATAIAEFARQHEAETFYAFTIDASMLCLNSEECAAVTLKKYQERWERYRTPEGIKELRENSGDWEYQGFARLERKFGFDDQLYQVHYDAAAKSSNGHAPDTEYSKAITELVARLLAMDAFSCLKRSSDFKASWVDHDY